MQLTNKFGFTSKIFVVLIATAFLAACGDGSKQNAEQKSMAAEERKPEINPALLTAQINTAPTFESQQGWSAGYTKAKGKGPGVIVGPGGDNPNVFAQPFTATPGESFKIVAKASSVDKPSSTGRIQINWTGPDGKFISVSSKVFDVAKEEKPFEHLVQAPPGTAGGTLYVVADGQESVVRYTEMRLLGKEKTPKAN